MAVLEAQHCELIAQNAVGLLTKIPQRNTNLRETVASVVTYVNFNLVLWENKNKEQ